MAERQDTPYVLFVCVHNSGRSQMARAFFERIAGGRMVALSAGTMPDEDVNPDVVRVMREVGIDISAEKPRLMTQEMVDNALEIVTMGCGVEGICPAVFVETVDWDLDDPKSQPLDVVHRIRDEVEAKVTALWEEVRSGGSEHPGRGDERWTEIWLG